MAGLRKDLASYDKKDLTIQLHKKLKKGKVAEAIKLQKEYGRGKSVHELGIKMFE